MNTKFNITVKLSFIINYMKTLNWPILLGVIALIGLTVFLRLLQNNWHVRRLKKTYKGQQLLSLKLEGILTALFLFFISLKMEVFFFKTNPNRLLDFSQLKILITHQFLTLKITLHEIENSALSLSLN
jgi:hypothetical protein